MCEPFEQCSVEMNGSRGQSGSPAEPRRAISFAMLAPKHDILSSLPAPPLHGGSPLPISIKYQNEPQIKRDRSAERGEANLEGQRNHQYDVACH